LFLAIQELQGPIAMLRRFSSKRQNRLLFPSMIAYLLSTAIGAWAAPTSRLQILVNDAAAQIQLSYRQYPLERQRRHEQLAAAIASWRAAEHSKANDERLAAWLQAAILSSMPGSRDPLPPAPQFAANVAPEASTQPNAALGETPVVRDQQADADPFQDDPLVERE
jgi:hypothetical protein